MNNNLLKSMIKNTNGKFFTCVFVKSNGEIRTMLARIGVKKGVKGIGLNTPEKQHLMKVYDMGVNDFRTINLDTLKSFKCGDVQYQSI